MTTQEQRKFIRYDALHLLDYTVLDENGDGGDYSMGRTIDVSVDGIKLETSIHIPMDSKLLITIGLEDDLVDLKGMVTHESPHNGRFLSGVVFLKVSKNGRRVFAKYVEAFQRRKAELKKQQDKAGQ
ncbi:MAG: PilZ domain-containing protein [Deltaproteobacteria bacterium]|nr:PilZ domain-containing protein [Deltaproteobacteria bacterium]MBW2659281.1 PilZ domain-containing protein [Deltaproteobacteria bacterium]